MAEINEVKLNGKTILSTRSNTVTEDTLVQGETAQNKAGESIEGRLDPVDKDKAYLISDEIGDIDNADYMPFYDVSDQKKKKTLFGSIVEKLKSVFAQKTDLKTHTYELGTEIPANADLNDYTTAGTYYCERDAIAQTLSNTPYTSTQRYAFKLVVMNLRNANTKVQIYVPNSMNSNLGSFKIAYRAYESTWRMWHYVATLNDVPFLSQPDLAHQISANEDLDDYTENGTYQCNNASIATTLSNCPVSTSFKLIVDRAYVSDASEIMQKITMPNNRSDPREWVRVRNYGATIWGAWKQLASTDDIAPSTVGNGYAVGTVSGSAITATISGFKLRAGVIVAIRLGSGLPANCTLNISNTGVKDIYYWGDNAIRVMDVGSGSSIYTFMYDGTRYRLLSWSLVPNIFQQSYVADTSGNIGLQVGYDKNAFAIKNSLGTNKLVWNYYKNSAWRGDVKIADYDDLNAYYNDYGVKNIFPWDLTTDIFKNLNYTTHTLVSGVVSVTVTNESANKGVYINTQTMNAYLADFNGKSLILSCEAKFDGAEHALSFGLDNNYANYTIGTDWTYIERTITLDTSLTNNHWHFYLQLAQNVTYHIRNLMIRPAIATDGTYEPYSITNQQIVNGLGASIAKTGKSILPSWRANTNVLTSNGVTATFNPLTGEITVNGTATANTYFPIFTGKNLPSTAKLPKGTYILSGCPSGGGSSKYQLAFYCSLGSWFDMGNGVTFTLSSDANLNDDLFIFVASGQTVSNLVFKPMLRPAFTTADYEPCEDIHKGNCYVGTCTTAGATKDKVAYVDGYFVLRKGVRVAIKFSNTNTYNSTTASPVTLNVNGTGAKYIWRWSNHTGASDAGTDPTILGVAGRYLYYIYDGTYWVWAGASGDNDHTNYLRNDAVSIMTTTIPFLHLKGTSIDTKQDNNGVTNTQYPAFTIQDKNGEVTTRLESVIETNGLVSTFMYARNYNKNTSQYFLGGLKVIADKIGNLWYNITNPEHFNVAIGHGYGVCGTAEATTAKTVAISYYQLAIHGYVTVKFTYNVPANATLNINSKGAKNIWYRGANITANVIKAGDLATFIYDGTRYQLVSNDRWGL